MALINNIQVDLVKLFTGIELPVIGCRKQDEYPASHTYYPD